MMNATATRYVLMIGLALALTVLGCGQAPRQKVFVLGIDGLTFDLLLPWAQEGKLPHFEEILEQGSSTQLVSAMPPSSPPAWTSAVTGVNPGKHGIFGFVKGIAPGEKSAPSFTYYTAQDRTADPLWVILSEKNRRSVVVNVPCSSPPDKIKGVMISGFPHTSLTNFTYPPEYRFKIPDYRKDIYGMMVQMDKEDAFLEDVNDIFQRRQEVVFKLLDEESWDLFFVVFTITDRVQHYFWKYMDANHPFWDPEKARLYGDTILKTYQGIDELLGQVSARLDDQTTLIVMSDHGFGPIYQPINGQNFIDRLPMEGDFSIVAADNFGAKFHLTTPQKPPYDPKTKENYALNKQMLRRALEDLRDPTSGQRVIQDVMEKEDIYWGPNAQQGPDIMALESKGYVFWNWRPTEDHQIFPKKDDPALRQFFSGFHLMNGVLIMSGPNVRRGMNNFDAQIMDIAPTVLYLLNEPIPQDMDGGVLLAPLSAEYIKDHPAQARWERPSAARQKQSPADSTETVNKFVEEQLKAIGYVQ